MKEFPMVKCIYTKNPKYILAEASDILSGLKINLYHNLKTIKILASYQAMEDDMWIKFRQMLIFDCLIGNNDRHDENWGILYASTISKLKLAPIYDNASCLTAGETEEAVVRLWSDKNKLEQFVNNSKPPNLYLKTNI